LFGLYCGEKLGEHDIRFGCGKLITGQFTTVDSFNYHPQCLICTRCKRNQSSAGQLFIHENKMDTTVFTTILWHSVNITTKLVP